MSWRLALRPFTKKCRQGLMAVMKNQDQSASWEEINDFFSTIIIVHH